MRTRDLAEPPLQGTDKTLGTRLAVLRPPTPFRHIAPSLCATPPTPATSPSWPTQSTCRGCSTSWGLPAAVRLCGWSVLAPLLGGVRRGRERSLDGRAAPGDPASANGLG